jgi:hypothetical protein
LHVKISVMKNRANHRDHGKILCDLRKKLKADAAMTAISNSFSVCFVVI